eukprot:CAMPEP_0184694928 /NCGR_PEP_ID=MMETSP0313-20130426/2722_1 /TAXON_ID=2792 /ORGANISM="Porphyridium aerugineum, Strain SAG 1380-2" /LENGTH=573 /DNA_ID=CAMNT_0027153293 /DNA_START=519 /DNA_END=2240 /DNA_ORIENTATION=-
MGISNRDGDNSNDNDDDNSNNTGWRESYPYYHAPSGSNNDANDNGDENDHDNHAQPEQISHVRFRNEPTSTFPKNFYKEHLNVVNRAWTAVDEFRRIHEIRVIPSSPQALCAKPIETLDEIMLPQYMMHKLHEYGVTRPTAIQSQLWPVILSGKNAVGVANTTNAGKTLSYLVPACIHINAQPELTRGQGPIALVLVSVRERAIRIKEEFDLFYNAERIRPSERIIRPEQRDGSGSGNRSGSEARPIKAVCIHGGVPRFDQIRLLEDGAELVIGTPGRLLELMQMQKLNLRRVTYLVLDGMDRMLDMGFEEDVKRVIHETCPDRQMLMFTSGWAREMAPTLVSFFGPRQFVRVVLGDSEPLVAANIRQTILCCQEYEKEFKLKDYLDSFWNSEDVAQNERLLIICTMRLQSEKLAYMLGRHGFEAMVIHRETSMSEREHNVEKYRSGECRILVITDAASRLVDLKGLEQHVILFDLPHSIELYINLINMAKASASGSRANSTSFVTVNNAGILRHLSALLRETDQHIPDDLWVLLSDASDSIAALSGHMLRTSSRSGNMRGRPLPRGNSRDGF